MLGTAPSCVTAHPIQLLLCSPLFFPRARHRPQSNLTHYSSPHSLYSVSLKAAPTSVYSNHCCIHSTHNNAVCLRLTAEHNEGARETSRLPLHVQASPPARPTFYSTYLAPRLPLMMGAVTTPLPFMGWLMTDSGTVIRVGSFP